MSGLEVIGAASAVLCLFESAFRLVEELRRANERRKDLLTVLDKHTRELTKTKNIIQTVKDEEALQTAGVAFELVEMDNITRRLVAALDALQNDKGRALQILHQLAHGSKDEDNLATIMRELSRAKSDLELRINVAHVGLTRTLQNTLIANTTIVERVDVLVQSVLGEGRGLKIATLLQNRPVQDDGTTALTNEDIASLRHEGGSEDLIKTPSTRIVIDNMTGGQAMQINGPVGVQEWYRVSHLEIKNNKATEKSIQINDGISTEAFSLLLQHR
ncbi:hypothetical protein V498_02017 [Pseudogymnoascus sp. VKM F-4517 (FW-2822)]|nr:hypothetical protein V498_02017 [Pseudogymnoascus sp. VKM F-4517 (FW-2822)]